jgi:hypothetical protein
VDRKPLKEVDRKPLDFTFLGLLDKLSHVKVELSKSPYGVVIFTLDVWICPSFQKKRRRKYV